MDMKIIDSFKEIPADVVADIIHEYDFVYDQVVAEYDDYFTDLWISLIANHGYIFRSQDDDI